MTDFKTENIHVPEKRTHSTYLYTFNACKVRATTHLVSDKPYLIQYSFNSTSIWYQWESVSLYSQSLNYFIHYIPKAANH